MKKRLIRAVDFSTIQNQVTDFNDSAQSAFNNVQQPNPNRLMPQQQLLDTTAKTGRDILKNLEQWKFELNQSKDVVENAQNNGKLMQDFNTVDKLMSGVYSTCFDLENFDYMPNDPYDDDQINLTSQDENEYDLAEEQPLEEIEDFENPPPEEAPPEENAEGGGDSGGMDMGGGDDGGGMDFNFG